MSAETDLANALYSLIEGARFAPQLNTPERQMRVDKAVQAIKTLIDENIDRALNRKPTPSIKSPGAYR